MSMTMGRTSLCKAQGTEKSSVLGKPAADAAEKEPLRHSVHVQGLGDEGADGSEESLALWLALACT